MVYYSRKSLFARPANLFVKRDRKRTLVLLIKNLIKIKYMFDLKVINSVVQQLEEERGIPREKTL